MDIQPRVIEIPDNFSIFSIAFSGDDQRLYAEVNWRVIDLWVLCVYYWPEVLGAFTVAVVVICLLLAWRVGRRPRQAGHVYCRRCNYELTEQDTQCAECGTRLTPGRVVKGRHFLRRACVPLALALTVAAAYGALWLFRAPRVGRVSGWFEWPSVGLLKWAENRSAKWLERVAATHHAIVEIDPVTGRVLRALFRPGGYWEFPLTATPDSTSLLFTDRHGRLVLLDAATGKVRQALAPPSGLDQLGSKWGSGWHSVAGFSDHGTVAYVCYFDDKDSASVVIRWDLRSGASNEAFRYTPASPGSGQLLSEERRFFVVPGTGGMRLAEIANFAAKDSYGSTSVILVHDLAQPGAPVVGRISGGFWSGSGLHFTAGGDRFFRKMWGADWAEWEVATGRVVNHGSGIGFGGTLTDTISFDPMRERLFVVNTGGVALMLRRGGSWELQVTLAPPSLPRFLPQEAFTFSPRGRWFALVANPGVLGREAIALYDLSSVP